VGRWALAALVPGLCTFAIMPWLLHQLCPPDLRDTEHARAHARAKLQSMGPMSRHEITLVIIMLIVVIGWITAPWHGTSEHRGRPRRRERDSPDRRGFLGDLLGDKSAWDALIWFRTAADDGGAAQRARGDQAHFR